MGHSNGHGCRGSRKRCCENGLLSRSTEHRGQRRRCRCRLHRDKDIVRRACLAGKHAMARQMVAQDEVGHGVLHNNPNPTPRVLQPLVFSSPLLSSSSTMADASLQPPPGIPEASRISTEQWQHDLVQLFRNVKDLFPDVVWAIHPDEDDDAFEEIWGHKGACTLRSSLRLFNFLQQSSMHARLRRSRRDTSPSARRPSHLRRPMHLRLRQSLHNPPSLSILLWTSSVTRPRPRPRPRLLHSTLHLPPLPLQVVPSFASRQSATPLSFPMSSNTSIPVLVSAKPLSSFSILPNLGTSSPTKKTASTNSERISSTCGVPVSIQIFASLSVVISPPQTQNTPLPSSPLTDSSSPLDLLISKPNCLLGVSPKAPKLQEEYSRQPLANRSRSISLLLPSLLPHSTSPSATFTPALYTSPIVLTISTLHSQSSVPLFIFHSPLSPQRFSHASCMKCCMASSTRF